MRRTKRRFTRLAAVALAAGVAAVPVASANAKTDLPAPTCGEWTATMKASLAMYGIEGRQADSYLAQRADNPCHGTITLRSLFHAGDPG
jgi:hypothetical protein